MRKINFIIVFFLALNAWAQDTGKITGIIVDSDGEALIGAFAKIEGTELTAFADINGSYTFKKVPVGIYTVTGNMDGFSTTTVEEVEVKAGETTTVNLKLGMEGIEQSIVVTAKALDNTEIGLISKRQESSSITDAISVEEISRGGGSNAADAVTKVVGASVVGGKYVFIRGLGDRYTSTHLNGVEMPTSDPDVKAFQADLFPTNILDNIVTLKSFTPDKPGNFSGGIIDIGTKSYPGEFTLNFSLSTSYNSVTTGNDNFLLYDGSGSDWRGVDDGLRGLPDLVANTDEIPRVVTARRDEELANVLSDVSKSFVPVMSPTEENSPLNSGFAVSVGNQIDWFGRRLGYLASLTYSRNYDFIEDKQTARWKLASSADTAETLIPQSSFVGNTGSDKVNWGGLVTLNYTLHPNHEIGANFIYTQGGESKGQFFSGAWPEQFSDDRPVLESRLLKYTERNLDSYQLRGKHYFPGKEISLDWTGSIATSAQDEPDTRIFTDHFVDVAVADGTTRRNYSITPSIYPNPARYFRSLQEESTTFKANLTIPFTQWGGYGADFKIGFNWEEKERDFFEDRYEYIAGSSAVRYDGDPDTFFGVDNMGIIGFDERTGRYVFGNVIQRSLDSFGGNYNGDMEVLAYYAMVELPLAEKWKLITGARMESAEMNVFNAETVGTLDDDDVLPAAAVIWQNSDNQNWRFSYGRTLARPNFREKAPYTSFDFIADGLFAGNPDLKRTLIDNFDLRWELYPRGGELIAASVFYKQFENPIEKAFNVRFSSEFGEKTFENVDEATVYGLEFEMRKRFDQMAASGSPHVFSGSMNFSLIESEVDIPDEELIFLLARDPNADPTRRLQGQSDYIFNLGLNYDNISHGTTSTLSYNIFGERIVEVGLGGAPNSLEQPRGMLDFMVSQPLWETLTIKFSAKNLLDSDLEILQTFKGQEFLRELYSTGRDFSLSISYKPQ